MPILNGEEFLERVLDALGSQEISIPWDFLAVDCGSTDRTLAIFEDYKRRLPVPLRVHGIHLSEFNHGDTRNLLVALSEGELAVFLTDDAIPNCSDWLARIAANFEDERVAACHLRNLSRPEVSELLKVTSARDPNYQAGKKKSFLTERLHPEGLDGAGRRALYNYNDVASAVRRSIWERYPYPHCDFGEDVLLGRAALEAGYGVVYEDGACVEHSHEYSCEQLFDRGRADALFNVEHLNYRCVEQESDIASLVARRLELDRADLLVEGVPQERLDGELSRSEREATAFFSGMYEGSLSERRFWGSGLNAGAYPTIEAHGVPSHIKRELVQRGWAFLAEGEGAEVMHVHGEDARDLERLQVRLHAGLPALWTIPDEWARTHGMQRSLLAAAECTDRERLESAPADLSLGTNPSGLPFELLIARGERDLDSLRGPIRERVVPPAEEWLRTLELRYRSLASSRQDPRGHCLLDRRGSEMAATEGDAEVITAGGLLLRAGAAAEWDIRGLPAGDFTLLITLESLGVEPGVVSGGQVFVDGGSCGVLGPYLSCGGDERRHIRLAVSIRSGCERIRLLARTSDGEGMVLRVRRLRIVDDNHGYGRRSVEECSLDLRGQSGVAHGKAAHEGCDMMRIGPKRGAGVWDVSGVGAGSHRLRIWLAFAECEQLLEQAGTVKLNGRAVATFAHVDSPQGGGTRLLETTVDLQQGNCSLVLSNRHHPLGIRGFARVQRLQLSPSNSGIGPESHRNMKESMVANRIASLLGRIPVMVQVETRGDSD